MQKIPGLSRGKSGDDDVVDPSLLGAFPIFIRRPHDDTSSRECIFEAHRGFSVDYLDNASIVYRSISLTTGKYSLVY